jgi:hypothetical protein
MTHSEAEQRIIAAYSAGEKSANSGKYDISGYEGNGIQSAFNNGFVSAAAHILHPPKDTPMYLVGRIAFLKGHPIDSKPQAEVYSGRWVSGWLTEKERTR